MKCQAWVDPTKFNKKGLPTPRAVLAPYNGSLDFALTLVTTDKQKTKLSARWAGAVRCGGRVEIEMCAQDPDEGYGIEVELSCTQCRECIHHVAMNAEVVEQWIQERLDAME